MNYERFWCFTRPSPVIDYKRQQDQKYIISNGIQVNRKRKSINAITDSFGNFYPDENGITNKWDEEKVYILLTQEREKENQTEFGDVSFSDNSSNTKLNIIKCSSSIIYDIKINDLIEIESKYIPQIPSNENDITIWKVKEINFSEFFGITPSITNLILVKRYLNTQYDNN